MGETETTADSDQKRPGDYLFPMSSVQRRVVHALSLSSAPLSHQHLLSCDATLGAAICLDCVTLPPSVREPWGASRHTDKVRVAYGIKERKKVGGAGLMEEERKGSEGGSGSMDKGKRGKMGRWWVVVVVGGGGGVKEISELTLL